MKTTKVIRIKITYKMIPKYNFNLCLIVLKEEVRSIIGRAFHNLGSLKKYEFADSVLLEILRLSLILHNLVLELVKVT